MSKTQRVFRPVLLEVQTGEYAGLYQVHMGRPGHPRVYKMVGKRGLTRVHEQGALEAVAETFKERYAAALEAEKAEARRRSTWHYRLRVWFGRSVARLMAALRWE